MNPDTGIAAEMFTVAIAAMAIFLAVWCLQILASIRRGGPARHRTWRGVELESEARGQRLLKRWLSPEQARCYDQFGYFDVVGSDSGTTYRVHHGTQANVEQLDDTGQNVCAWCFVPEGDLVAGDVMLTQKIALETNERRAIAVARRYPVLGNRARRVPRFFVPQG